MEQAASVVEPTVSAVEFLYDGFLSYRSQTDYARARWVESFLEGLHLINRRAGAPVRPLRICRDGSDFRLLAKRDKTRTGDHVWGVIRSELERSSYLLVLCSPGAPGSSWMEAEIGWFLDHRPENILLLVTEAKDPVTHPEECFPREIIRRGLHTTKIWYDLRGRESGQQRAGVRDWEDEIVRLAADLLKWDADAYGPLWSIYEREQLRTQRRQAGWVSAVAVVVLIVAAIAGWYAVQSNRQARRARANAVVSVAQASVDPLAAALMLTELDDEPQGGLSVARGVAAQDLAIAELRGPQSAVAFLQFLPGADELAAVSADGLLFLWRRDGHGDPLRSAASAGGYPVGLAISPDGRFIATATREHKAVLWSPRDGGIWSFEVPGMIESILFVPGESGALLITDDGKGFVVEPNQTAREFLPQGPAIAALHILPDSGLLIAARDGELWRRSLASRKLERLPGPPRAVLDDFPFRDPSYARFSPDGEWFALAAFDLLLLRSTHHPKQFYRIELGSLVTSIAFDSDSKWLAAGGSGGVAAVWEASTGKKLQEFNSKLRFWRVAAGGVPEGSEPESLAIQQLGFAPGDSNLLAVLTDDSRVRLWDMRGGNPREFHGHIGAQTFAWTPKGDFLATGAEPGTVRIWPMKQTEEPVVLRHSSAVVDALFLTGNRVVSLSRDGSVREFSGDTYHPHELPPVGQQATALALADTTAPAIFVGFEDGTVRLAEGEPLSWTRHFKPLDERISQLIVRGTHVVSVSERRVAATRMQPPLTTQSFEPVGSKIRHVDVSAQGTEFVVAQEDGTVLRRVLGDSTPQVLQTPDSKAVFEARYSPDGKQLVTCSENGSAVLHTLGSREGPKKLQLPSDGEWLDTCAFSPDGRHILVTSFSGRAWLADARGEDPQLLRRANGLAHVGAILSIAFSADSSRVLLTGGVDGQATVWDAQSLALSSVLSGHAGTVTTGAISPDGTRFLTAGEDGSVRLWWDGWNTLIQHLKLRTTATLNPNQRMSVLGESPQEAWDAFLRREKSHGRSGVSYGPFKSPF